MARRCSLREEWPPVGWLPYLFALFFATEGVEVELSRIGFISLCLNMWVVCRLCMSLWGESRIGRTVGLPDRRSRNKRERIQVGCSVGWVRLWIPQPVRRMFSPQWWLLDPLRVFYDFHEATVGGARRG